MTWGFHFVHTHVRTNKCPHTVAAGSMASAILECWSQTSRQTKYQVSHTRFDMGWSILGSVDDFLKFYDSCIDMFSFLAFWRMVPWWPWVVRFYIGAATPEPLALLAEELGSRMTSRLKLSSVETKLEPELKSKAHQKTTSHIRVNIYIHIIYTYMYT